MIPSDIRLYTWVDVEDVLLRVQEQNQWPEWLVWARAYWDGLTLGIRPETRLQARDWLGEIYDPRFKPDPKGEADTIILEGIPGRDRTLPILFEETEEAPQALRLVPRLARPGVIWPPSPHPEPPPTFPPDLPPVVVFHSFKGGVGRTIHALALAQAMARDKHRILLVDGDLEAPGISWLLQKRLSDPPVSFADFLALVHSDPDPEGKNSIQLVADRLQGALIDEIYVLPAFRSTERFTSLEVRPEHLVHHAEDPFLLTRLLADLGRALDVAAVLVDLRAGLSELAAGLLLDPRVYRIFVTTLSEQAVLGTMRLLELVGHRAPSTREEDPLPALIMAQVPKDHHGDLLVNQEQRLLEVAKPFLGDGENRDPLEDRDLLRVSTPFDSNLLVLPSSWEEVMTRLQRSEIVDLVRPLIGWLPGERLKAVKETDQGWRRSREALKDSAERLIYAESGEGEDFLATTPLRHLASDHRQQVPIAVVVGAKGAGKTYTFLQVIRRESWEAFAKDAGARVVHAFVALPGESPLAKDAGMAEARVEALICPVLEPKNLASPAQKLVRQVRQKTARGLGFTDPADIGAIRDHIRNGFQIAIHEGQWRERWLDVMAWGVGFQPQREGAGRALASNLDNAGKRLVIVVDGLEDLFQDLSGDKAQQTALRALLQEVPEWLGQQPRRPMGILIFVRRDMVLAAVRQNAAQLMARYETYALKWNREEALRLVAWVTMKAEILSDLKVERLQNMEEQELIQELIPLWGRKLGSDRSREGRSAEWVIAALSDFRGQIQARDLVRLLHLAAKKSVTDPYWKDRVLVPSAIKNALPECSGEKIKEIEVENEALKSVLTKLRNLPTEKRQIPFAREDVQVSPEEIKILEDNGVVLREGDEYYMPEVFRLGLEFSLQSAARPRVLTLARRAGREG